MKKSLFAGVAVLGLSMFAGYSYSADDAKTEKITGVLIDQTCGANQMKKDDPEAAAAKHPASCAKKESCAKSGYAIITGKKMLKLDDAGAEKAKAYLEKSNVTKVVVEGTKDGDTLKVTSIEAAK
jgi:hypothetical protein